MRVSGFTSTRPMSPTRITARDESSVSSQSPTRRAPVAPSGAARTNGTPARRVTSQPPPPAQREGGVGFPLAGADVADQDRGGRGVVGFEPAAAPEGTGGAERRGADQRHARRARPPPPAAPRLGHGAPAEQQQGQHRRG